MCLKVVIVALVPGFLTLPNTLGNSIATNDFISLMLFWGISLPLHAVPVSKFRTPGKIVALSAATTFLAIVIICLVKAGGGGPLLRSPYGLVGVIDIPVGADLAWAIIQGITNVMASNAPDFTTNYTCFAKSPSAAIPALIANQLVFTLGTILFGILSTSAANQFFPEDGLLWAPYDLLMAFQVHGGNGARAGAFFGGISLVLAQLGINVAGQVLALIDRLGMVFDGQSQEWLQFWSSMDYYLSTITIWALKRLLAGLAINPWNLAEKISGFNRFLGGTAVFSGPIFGVILFDYFALRRQIVKVADLYIFDASSIYWYHSGVNLRAAVALLVTSGIFLPGLINDIANNGVYVEPGWKRLYAMSYVLGIVLSGTIYWTLSHAFPPRALENVREPEELPPAEIAGAAAIIEDACNRDGSDAISLTASEFWDIFTMPSFVPRNPLGVLASRPEWLSALESLPEGGRIPSFFFGHGSEAYSSKYEGELMDFGETLLRKYKPKGIVVFSGHWETDRVRHVTDYADENPLHYDYYGFPQELYDLTWRSRGSKALSEEIVSSFLKAGLPARTVPVTESRGRDGRPGKGPEHQGGFDHGVFIPFKLMFPDTNGTFEVPVVEVSIAADLKPESEYQIGKALKDLRDDGILILAGGLTIHSFEDRSSLNERIAKPAFHIWNDKIIEAVQAKGSHEERRQALFNLIKEPEFRLAHPREASPIPP
ncbi:MAG: hypothetical protein CYPHOPRED_004747 [Cyphobasidiales sp. Tagirdzhanova-0007]|nr:MAG: hypothetical protein CYPHOPRED_004747 [Cyphobasidiales sp. Tagirdzhanova-0007]